MKRIYIVLLATLLLSATLLGACGGEAAPPPGPPRLLHSEVTEEHIGQTITVYGPVAIGFVVTIAPGPVKPVVIVLGLKGASDAPDATFFMPGNLVINITPVKDAVPGDPTTYYTGKTIAVTGEVTLSPIDKPEIIVTDLSQIVIE